MKPYAPWVAAMLGALQADDAHSFDVALAGFDGVRNSEVTLRVRRVASGLQSALERFRVDSKLIDLAQNQVPDARHRLAHVLRLTDDAAHRTMDLVEQCCPLADQMAHEAERLIGMPGEGSQQLLPPQITAFLKRTGTSMAAVRSNLAEVLLAQGYQDLSGQIIRGVMTLVEELDQALGDLVRIAGAGQHATERVDSASATRAHGPVVPGINHGHAVAGQQDVDALLSDLGV
ncbi:MAG TPA: protein phosphatase CheZ [Steroidobacteraceae bacterium]